jgi:hypothetical protein
MDNFNTRIPNALIYIRRHLKFTSVVQFAPDPASIRPPSHPGPGQYQVAQAADSVHPSRPAPHSVFNSVTERFGSPTRGVPGPGEKFNIVFRKSQYLLSRILPPSTGKKEQIISPQFRIYLGITYYRLTLSREMMDLSLSRNTFISSGLPKREEDAKFLCC